MIQGQGERHQKLLVDLIKKEPEEIHLKITSPPIISPCYYGMDFPSSQELIANQHNQNIEEIRAELGVTSLEYLTTESSELRTLCECEKNRLLHGLFDKELSNRNRRS